MYNVNFFIWTNIPSVVMEDVNVRGSWVKGAWELFVLSLHLLLLYNKMFIKSKTKVACKQESFSLIFQRRKWAQRGEVVFKVSQLTKGGPPSPPWPLQRLIWGRDLRTVS